MRLYESVHRLMTSFDFFPSDVAPVLLSRITIGTFHGCVDRSGIVVRYALALVAHSMPCRTSTCSIKDDMILNHSPTVEDHIFLLFDAPPPSSSAAA